MHRIYQLVFLSFFLVFIRVQASAQLFNQKQTYKKNLIQQIAFLQLYIGYVKKCYSIAKTGLNTISDIKNGEFRLHDEFYSSLKKVNPGIAKLSKVAEIIALQVKIIHVYKKAYQQAQESNVFNLGEIRYIYRVYGRLLDDCAGNIDKLMNVTTNNKLDMKDDERLKRVDELYNDMQDKYTFIKRFSNETMTSAASRRKEINNIQTSRLLNGIKTK